jgi:prepilin peptidase CpaA
MSTGGMLMLVPMFGLLTWAAIVDLRTRRIPNWLTLSLMLSGLAQSYTWAHTVSPWTSFLGLLMGFGLTFVLFAIGAMGGGDVKLMAGLGAWLGPWPTLGVSAIAAIIGMIIVVVQAACQGRLTRLFRNSAVIAMSLATANSETIEQAAETGKACSSTPGRGKPLPYAVPVFFATALLLIRL